jgi:hypothetical protein
MILVLLLVTQENGIDLDGVGRIVLFLCWPCRENIDPVKNVSNYYYITFVFNEQFS